MIKKWDLAPSPTPQNKSRHKLLLKAEMKDIFLIVKKMGGTCSRPEKTAGDYDFMIYILQLDPEILAKLKKVVEELMKMEQEEKAEEFKPVKSAAASAPRPAVPADSAGVKKTEKPSVPPVKESPPKTVVPPVKREAPPVQPQPAVAAGYMPPSQKDVTSRIKIAQTDAGKPPEVKKEAPVPASAVQITAKPADIPAKAKSKWAIEIPLIPTYTFDTLIAGSHNRFAHAAGMAVVENPGVMYNPLLIFGPPGAGKTHFIHSIFYGISSSMGQGNIFVTDGVRFSKGIDLAVRDGSIAKLDAMFSKIKVLIIDDVHLAMISESNKKYISKWLNDFISSSRQVVISSVFPPKTLSGLEDNLGFQFTQGWMVDLKLCNAQTYKMILNQILAGMDVKLSDEEVNLIFSGSPPFSEVIKILRGMKKLEKFIIASKPDITHKDLLDMIMGFSTPLEDTGVIDEEELSKGNSFDMSAKSSWLKWGMFFPKGSLPQAKWLLYKIVERGREIGIDLVWEQVFMEEYNPDELYGIPFKIGNYSDDRRVSGVIIMGPQPTSALGAQENEFAQITERILDSFLIRNTWIPNSRLKSHSGYVKALMNLL
ncbi:MAG: ATP-binding protein [Elusimicrobia bacterium]|nr:ATP-binding protein [Elusimicrobiota bacterium]